mgnify:CR=1 FL=1
MTKMSGLGKGLDALFGGNVSEEEVTLKDGEEKVEQIKLINIEPNRDQPRKKFNEESLEELSESIKKYGVIQPIIVTNKDEYYQIIAGERRWRAAKKAGLSTIPCIVRNEEERKRKEIALIENIQREDLNPIEKARGFRQLIDEYNMTQQELADTLGMSRPTVTNTLRILNLDDRVIELAESGQLTEGHCKAILSIQDPEKQYKTALKIIEQGTTVNELREKNKAKNKVAKKDQKYEAIFRDIEDRFQGFFGTKVKLTPGKKKGKIVIEYNSNEHLER